MILISKNLEFLRKKSGFKQIELSEKLGIKANTISNYEKGVSQPDYKILKLLTEIFNVSADELLYSDLSDNNRISRTLINNSGNNYPLNNYRLKIKDETTTYNKIEKEENIESEKIYLDLIKSQEEKIQSLNRTIGRLEYEIEILKQNQIEEPVVRDVGCAAAG